MDDWDKIVVAASAVLTIWLGRIHWIVSHTLHIHRNADEHGFGTRLTNAMLDENKKLWMDTTNSHHRDTQKLLQQHTRILRQIAHATEFYGEIRTGKKLPPQIDIED